jgi:Cytochrome oxidase complex assembly protein 1
MPTTLKRPLGVTIIALVYLWIGCGGTVFFPIIALTGDATATWQPLLESAIYSEALLRTFEILLSTLLFLAYIAYALCGFGLWKLRNWARKTVVGINAFFLVAMVIAAPILARPLLLAIPILICAAVPFSWMIWYLMRPRVRYAFGAGPREPACAELAPQRLTKMGVAWIVMGVVAAFTLFFVSVFALVETMFQANGGYRLALDEARKSPCVARTLGSPFTADWLATGSTNENGSEGTAKLLIPIRGPKGKGSLDVEAHKSDGIWKIDSLDFMHGDDEVHLVPSDPTCQ